MSWKAYVDDSLVASGKVDKGAIFSAAGDSVWAASPDFNVTPEELKSVTTYFQSQDPAPLYKDGLHIGGEKYVLIRADQTLVVGKKGKDGVIVAKSKMAIIIGHHNDGTQTQEASMVTQSLAEYLIKVGY